MTWDRFAELLVAGAGLYAALGLLFGLSFVARGVERIDRAAKGAGWGFRLIILPGVVAFWPLLAARWWRGTTPPQERNAHRRAAGGGG